MTGNEASELIRNWKKRTLKIHETIVGNVIIPAGCFVKTLELWDVQEGAVTMGGYSMPDAPKRMVTPGTHEIIHRATGTVRTGGRLLAYNRRGEHPVCVGMTVRANIDNRGGNICFYGTKLHDCELQLHVSNSKVQGVKLELASHVALTGSAASIGVPKITGQGYACEISGCADCTIQNWAVFGARSGVQLNGGGQYNRVINVHGRLHEYGVWADVHGGIEIEPYFEQVDTVKLGNEAWSGEPVGVQFGSNVRSIIRLVDGVPIAEATNR